MLSRKIIVSVLFVLPILCSAMDNLSSLISTYNIESSTGYGAESKITNSTTSAAQKEAEKLETYTGVLGTAPTGKTISAAGAAIEEIPTGPDLYIFYTQTLAN